jgi:hypothetical protein
MANICLTTTCNRHCAYCFAPGEKGPFSGVMRAAVFHHALDFLERSGIQEARLLGGEPTLHPDFIAFAETALLRGFRLQVFTNGLMPERVLRWLQEVPSQSVLVLINATEFRQAPAWWDTIGRLTDRVMLGFNISTPFFQPEYLLDRIDRHGFRRAIRFGLAHPRLDGSNDSLHPRYYRAAGSRLAAFFPMAREACVELQFDCGFVPCMFPPDDLAALGASVADIGTRCSPILDLLPDGRILSCFPLAELHQELLSGSETADAVRTRFEEILAGRRRLGAFSDCVTCGFRSSRHCTGGCLAAAMQRLRPARPASVQAGIPVQSSWAVPYVDQPIGFWERLEAEFGSHIREVYFPLPGRLLGSGRPPQPDAHLDMFLKSSTLPRSVLINPIFLPQPVDEIAPKVIEALRRLVGEYGIGSATVSNLLLAARIRGQIPDLPLTASILMDVCRPNQILMLGEIFDCLVPSGRILRDLPALRKLRAAYAGRIRLIVNEACLPGCPYRGQHFYEMAVHPAARSLCAELLEQMPWMRLTGCWVLPQHLHFFDSLCDEWKLSGRVSLQEPAIYRRVLRAYIRRTPMSPHEIGGGPASVLDPIAITEEFYQATLECERNCYHCRVCREYYDSIMLMPFGRESRPGGNPPNS